MILENYTEDDRVIRNGVFIVEKITNDDRGFVVCVGEDIMTGQSYQDSCMVRIKGMIRMEYFRTTLHGRKE